MVALFIAATYFSAPFQRRDLTTTDRLALAIVYISMVAVFATSYQLEALAILVTALSVSWWQGRRTTQRRPREAKFRSETTRS